LDATTGVALTLLRDGFSEAAIVRRTGVATDALYEAAVALNIRPAHGTAERALVDQAAGEVPCTDCQKALGSRQSRQLAAAKVAATRRQVTARLRARTTRHRPSRSRGTRAAAANR
jgi:hypothetical protein